MYDLLKRGEIYWRDLNIQTAKAVYKQNSLTGSHNKVLVLDDSIKTRSGRKWKVPQVTLITLKDVMLWGSRC
jgi:hypothetical protein